MYWTMHMFKIQPATIFINRIRPYVGNTTLKIITFVLFTLTSRYHLLFFPIYPYPSWFHLGVILVTLHWLLERLLLSGLILGTSSRRTSSAFFTLVNKVVQVAPVVLTQSTTFSHNAKRGNSFLNSKGSILNRFPFSWNCYYWNSPGPTSPPLQRVTLSF